MKGNNTKNNRFFDKGLFIEGIRQTRVIGIVSGVLLILAIVLIACGFISNQILEVYEDGFINIEKIQPIIVGPPMLSIFSIVQVYLFSPLLTLHLFKFLNKRKSSDFYHAIPHRRECIFFSYFAAISFWNIILTCGSVLFSSLLICCLPTFFKAVFTYTFSFAFNLTAASLLVSAAIALVMSITGNIVSNVFVSAMLLFVPRIMFTGFATIVYSLNYVTSGIFPEAFSPSYNIPAALPTYIFKSLFGVDGNVVLATFTKARYGVSTLILALIYVVIGVLLFKVRHSEAAEKSTSSKLIQSITRIGFAFVICCIPVAIIYCIVLEDHSALSAGIISIYGIIVWYIIAILAYILYEAISAKSFKNIHKCLPGLGVLAVINVLAIFIMLGGNCEINSFQPSADEIKGVSISLSEFVSDSNFYADKYVDITNDYKGISKLISERLKSEIKNNISGEYSERSLNVKIKTAGSSKIRKIDLSTDEYYDIINAAFSSDNMKKVLEQFPDENSSMYNFSISPNNGASADDARKLYGTFKKELMNCSSDDLRKILNNIFDAGENDDSGYMFGYIYVSDAIYEQVSFPVTSLTPKTAKMYTDILNNAALKDGKPVDKMIIDAMMKGDDGNCYLSARSSMEDDKHVLTGDYEALAKYLLTIDYKNPKNGDVIVVEVNYDNNDLRSSYTYYFFANKKDFPKKLLLESQEDTEAYDKYDDNSTEYDVVDY